MTPSIFRAYDIRGIVDETLNEEVVTLIGQAIGSAAQARHENTVIIARDGRLSGPAYHQALANGIQQTGCHVIDIGAVPTPLLYFATHTLNSKSGVMITGSHNPSNYNGFKIVIDGETLYGDAIQQLHQRIVDKDFVTGQGTYQQQDIISHYQQRIVSDIKLKRRLKVVVDCGNGIAGKIAPDLLRALDCEVVELFCEVDGHFPNHHPDPSQLANLQDLIKTVKQTGADIGLAFDGDGDRLGVITCEGENIWPDRQLMLYAIDVLARNPNATILYDVKCTQHLAPLIRKHQGQPLMCKTGHSLVKAKMKETAALLGGEMSGHIFFKERWYGFDDGLYTAARLLEILSGDSRNASEIFQALPNSVNTPELKLPIADQHKFVFMQRFAEQATFPDAKLTTIDGLRADFADGWGLIRPSNTTPCLVLRFEGDTQQAIDRIQQSFKEQLLALDGQLQLPF